MQNRTRKGPRNKINERIGQKTSSCFKRLTLISVSIFVYLFQTGCSTNLYNERVAIKNLNSSFSKMCLDSEGTGRIKFLSKRHSFKYETLFEKSKEFWTLGVEMPLSGQKMLTLNYKEILKKKIVISGKFYAELVNEIHRMKNSRYYRSMLNKYLMTFSYFLKLKSMFKSEINASNCSLSNKERGAKGQCKVFNGLKEFSFKFIGDGVTLIFKIDNSHEFIMKFKDLADKCFKQSKFYLRDINKGGPDKDLIILEMFI